MRCLVKIGFAGITYCSAAGKVIDLPKGEANSLQAQGIVEILENVEPEMAYETAEEARLGKRFAVKHKR
jgi:hypothetical protein